MNIKKSKATSSGKTGVNKKRQTGKITGKKGINSVNNKKTSKVQSRMDPDWKMQVLRQRAETLARESSEKNNDGELLDVVEFLIADERYGIESVFVDEVYPLKEYTIVPCTPQFVLGITNIRGQIITVIDIKHFFDFRAKGLTDLTRIIVVNTPHMKLGILADRLIGTSQVPLKNIHESLPALSEVNSPYIRGVTEDRLILLDMEKMLSDPNIVVCQEVEF